MRGCSRSMAAWPSDSTLPSADKANPRAVASPSSAAGRRGNAGNGIGSLDENSAETVETSTSARSTTTDAPIACATVLSEGDRP